VTMLPNISVFDLPAVLIVTATLRVSRVGEVSEAGAERQKCHSVRAEQQHCERLMQRKGPSFSTGDAAITIVYGP
jgi:hypothetical protein